MTPCVLATNLGHSGGYGRVTIDGQRFFAHRVAWALAHGTITEGWEIHHACENHGCVNVEHLELIPPTEHRRRHRRCEHGEEERIYLANGHSYCRTCKNAKRRHRYATDPAFRERDIQRARKSRMAEGMAT